MNALVVGPGLGRDESIPKIYDIIMNFSKDLGKDKIIKEYGM